MMEMGKVIEEVWNSQNQREHSRSIFHRLKKKLDYTSQQLVLEVMYFLITSFLEISPLKFFN